MNLEFLYEKHFFQIENIVRKLCKRFFFFTEIEDLRAQANLLFCIAFKRYNCTKSSFSTYLYYQIYWGLHDYIQEELKRRKIETDLPVIEYQQKISNLLFSLSEEAKEVVSVLFSLPDELLNLHPQKKVRQKTIKEYLRKKGWKHNEISIVFNEIKGVLQ